MKLSLLLRSCCALGCLVLILIPITIYYLINKESDPHSPSQVSSTSIVDPSESQEKAVRATVIMASDMESDFPSLENFVKTINEDSVDAVFILGDITTLGVKEDFVKSKSILNKSKVKVYYLPGDRDLWKSGGSIKNFKEILGDNYQLVDVNGVKFLMIDNANEYEGIDSTQFSFIESNLGSADYVLMHNPVYFNDSLLGLMGKGMGQYSVEVNDQRNKLLGMIRTAPLVKATFAGDQHVFSVTDDSEEESLSHVILGSLSSIRNLDVSNYIKVKIYEDKTFSVEKLTLPFEVKATEANVEAE